MKRYDFVVVPRAYEQIIESPEGEWVKYSDILPIVNEYKDKLLAGADREMRLIEAVKAMSQALEHQLEITVAQSQLLICYRLDKNPSEKILNLVTMRGKWEEESKTALATADSLTKGAGK